MLKAKRLSVKSLADATKQLRAAHDEIENQVKLRLKEEQDAIEARGARRAAEDRETKTREQFADLKKRLFGSEQECARLRGYMERVREDDAVADPMVEVEDGGGKRMVSKRFPSNAYLPSNGCNAMSADFDNYGNRREKPKHWVTY